jgi:hypothetical protein
MVEKCRARGNAFWKFGVPGKSAGIRLRRRVLRAARLTARPETASDAPSPAWGDEVGPRARCDRPREMRFPAPSSGLAKQPDFGRFSISEFPNGITRKGVTDAWVSGTLRSTP